MPFVSALLLFLFFHLASFSQIDSRRFIPRLDDSIDIAGEFEHLFLPDFIYDIENNGVFSIDEPKSTPNPEIKIASSINEIIKKEKFHNFRKIQTLTNPSATLYLADKDYFHINSSTPDAYTSLVIAIRNKNKWKYFSFMTGIKSKMGITKYSRTDFDGKGYKELIIEFIKRRDAYDGPTNYAYYFTKSVILCNLNTGHVYFDDLEIDKTFKAPNDRNMREDSTQAYPIEVTLKKHCTYKIGHNATILRCVCSKNLFDRNFDQSREVIYTQSRKYVYKPKDK